MTTSVNPFLDSHRTRHDLYAGPRRLAQRTSALHAAKVSGQPVAEVIAELADGSGSGTVLDVGCGRGSTTAHLAQAWSPRLLIGVDQSWALLAEARGRMPDAASAHFACADFHGLPVPDSSVDVIVAAFCLYHAAEPVHVIAEFQRCLQPGGVAVLVTKSAESYRALDELIAAAGVDPDALSRPSLYETFHSGNAPTVAAQHLAVRKVIHHEHRFHFADADHVAQYVATSPKYALAVSPDAVADRLRSFLGRDGQFTTSTVSYVVAARS